MVNAVNLFHEATKVAGDLTIYIGSFSLISVVKVTKRRRQQKMPRVQMALKNCVHTWKNLRIKVTGNGLHVGSSQIWLSDFLETTCTSLKRLASMYSASQANWSDSRLEIIWLFLILWTLFSLREHNIDLLQK